MKMQAMKAGATEFYSSLLDNEVLLEKVLNGLKGLKQENHTRFSVGACDEFKRPGSQSRAKHHLGSES